MRILAILICIIASYSALAACTQIQVDRIFDGYEFREAHYITIENQRIKKIGNIADQKCKLIRTTGATALPGLIDTHSLIFAWDDSYGVEFAKALVKNQAMSKKTRFKMAKNKLCAYARAGFTTLRDLGNSAQYYDVELRERIKQMKLHLPTMYVSGPGIAAKGGQFPPGITHNEEYTDFTHRNKVLPLIKHRIKMGVNWVKLYADNDPNPNLLNVEGLKSVVASATKYNLPVAIHATNRSSIGRAIKANPTSIQHGYHATRSQLDEMTKKQIFLVPTDRGDLISKAISNKIVSPYKYHFDEIFKRDRPLLHRRMKDALEAGTKIAFGSDYYLATEQIGIPFITGVYSSLYALKEGGMTNTQALRAATSSAAELLNDSNIGRISSGSWANITIVKGDPEKNLRALESVDMVFIKGKNISTKGSWPCPNTF